MSEHIDLSTRVKEAAKVAGSFAFHTAFLLLMFWAIYIKWQLPKQAPIAFAIGSLVGGGWVVFGLGLGGLKTKEKLGSGQIKLIVSWFVDIAAVLFMFILAGTVAGALLAGFATSGPINPDCAPGLPGRYCD